jgi:hypothetical protein
MLRANPELPEAAGGRRMALQNRVSPVDKYFVRRKLGFAQRARRWVATPLHVMLGG